MVNSQISLIKLLIAIILFITIGGSIYYMDYLSSIQKNTLLLFSIITFASLLISFKFKTLQCIVMSILGIAISLLAFLQELLLFLPSLLLLISYSILLIICYKNKVQVSSNNDDSSIK